MRELAPPRLFANRHCWSLAAVADRPWTLAFADCLYFDGVDVQEALAHESALTGLDSAPGPGLRDLPLRRAVGDPFALGRRTVLAAVSTLTVRRDRTGATFLLHRRDPRAVAQSGGATQVIPSGIFQPSTSLPGAAAADFDLWRNIMREYSEELLGAAEHGGDGRPVDYGAAPFAALDAAYRDGRVRVWLLGVGLDALSLFGEIMTVAVWDAAFFDDWARHLVADNEEGALVASPLPFTAPVVRALLRSGRMLPAGAGCLHLAWRHRAALACAAP
ncbi:hypothetical protein GCM10010124_27440 [Pilimelia terevasa]|uniref:Uncharacterized protein n=1 Tax=Pilimelia terevasa TaxID=53372 RepID=A0A8J3BMX8_9ACTN|nr:hypothetical protein [Pilimelia terevasa]GGK33225.1 hypothetical protein GCM10010124_27440 [Pilimelia terevasa]